MSKNSIPGIRNMSTYQLIQQIAESNGNGTRFCFILGSGASVESGIPSGTTLEKRWMDCIMGEADDYPAKRKNPSDSLRLAKDLKEAKLIKYDFSKIVSNWSNCCRDPSNKQMSSEYYFDIYKLRFYPDKANGYRYLERIIEGCEPSIGYYPLSLMLTENNQNNLVITTNFDSLVEDALSMFSEKKPLVVGHESLAGFISTDIQRPIIAKVHRSLFYDPFNTPETTDHLSDEWKKALRIVFHTYTPIVIGYAGGDGSLMTFLEDEATSMRHGIFWCYRGTDIPEKRVLKLVEKKNGFFVHIDGFDALMLEIGKEFFHDKIHPTNTQKILKERVEKRVENYNKRWNDLNKTPELKNIISQLDQLEQLNEEAREKEGKLTYWDHMRRANNAADEGQYEKAIQEYTEAITLRHDSAIAYNNRGYAYSKLKICDNAINDFSKAIELKPDFVEAYNNRGATYCEMDESSIDDTIRERAISDFSRAIDLKPDFAEAYINRGAVYDDMKQYDDAINNYSKAIELKPDSSEAYANRGVTYKNKGEKGPAISDFNKSIELDSRNANPHRHLGSMLFDQGILDKAAEELSEAIEINSEYVEAYEDRAKVFRSMEKDDLAKHDEKMVEELRKRR